MVDIVGQLAITGPADRMSDLMSFAEPLVRRLSTYLACQTACLMLLLIKHA